MDHTGISPNADFVVLSSSRSRCLSPPDSETRGRRRRRDPVPFSTALRRPHHDPSVESSTLRGRGRRRSPSRSNLLPASRISSCSHKEATTTEELTRRFPGMMVVMRSENHQRSQSPSRSRSPGPGNKLSEVMFSMARRRQRTQSRSREHGQGGSSESGGLVMMERPSLALGLLATGSNSEG